VKAFPGAAKWRARLCRKWQVVATSGTRDIFRYLASSGCSIPSVITSIDLDQRVSALEFVREMRGERA
jgi:hypothetical protein